MSVVRPDVRRFRKILLLAVGVLALGLGRPARASQEFYFSQVLSLQEACLNQFDVFDSYWRFDGRFFLDTTLYFDDWGGCYAYISGYTDSRGLNYRLGNSAKMEIWFGEWVDCYFDPVDHSLRAKVRFDMNLRGAGGGNVPMEMRLMFTSEGADVLGVTVNAVWDPWDDWDYGYDWYDWGGY
jgi:hypothetical protein